MTVRRSIANLWMLITGGAIAVLVVANVVNITAPDNETQPRTVAKPVPTETIKIKAVRAVDGDTIELSDGRMVRVIGIDTPERGQCGYKEAGALMASYVVGKTVTLIPGARTDTDRYGRLLRYVQYRNQDIGLQMIKRGRAIARYDSRDGYGRHPREDRYIAEDKKSPSANVCAPIDTPSPT